MLLWLDFETTGLSPREDCLLEAGWRWTNDDLSEMMPTSTRQSALIDTFIRSPQLWSPDKWPQIVQDMHRKSGLLADLQNELMPKISHIELEQVLKKQIIEVAGDEKVKLAGASVQFDRSFIDYWLPAVSPLLSHRQFDTSTLKQFFGQLSVEHGVAEDTYTHRALADVDNVLEISRSYARQVIEGGIGSWIA